MQTSKGRTSSSEVPQKLSPRSIRSLRTPGMDLDSVSPARQGRTPVDRSPKVADRRSPRSPVTERKRPSRLSELENQISLLQDELKGTKGRLSLSESSKKQAMDDAEESKKQLANLLLKLESQEKSLGEEDESSKQKLDGVQHVSVDTAELCSALIEIQLLKAQVKAVSESEAEAKKVTNSVHAELQTLQKKLADTVCAMENMTIQLRDSKKAELQAQSMANRALLQLETAKHDLDKSMSDDKKAVEAYNSIESELEESRARVTHLEKLLLKQRDQGDIKSQEDVESDICSEKAQTRSEEILTHSRASREAELEAEVKKTKAMVDSLKADLIDKETELQGISEENEGLRLKLENNISCQNGEMEEELVKMQELVSSLRTTLIGRDAELQKLQNENEKLRNQVSKMADEGDKFKELVTMEVEKARDGEREALLKVERVMEEAERHSKKVGRVTEQLEAAQATNSEMETELRRMKVQSDQWRKAAEAAASMISTGNNNGKLMDRSGSLDGQYSPAGGTLPTYIEDGDDDLKKRNGSVLRKIGVLLKKSQK